MPVKQVIIYTDGACIGNPGPGGYGVVMKYGDKRKELSGGFRRTTNNRMELMAAIVSLEALKENCHVMLYSDSRYVVESFSSGAAERWRANGWMRDRKNPALNVDLWDRLLHAAERHRVEMIWVQGHAGERENERCDQLSVQAAKGIGLAVDSAYEDQKTRQPSAQLL
jgi:ribonuclease HI